MKKIWLLSCFILFCLFSFSNVLALNAGGLVASANNFCSNNENIVRYVFGTNCTGDLTFVLAVSLWVVFLLLFFDGIASFTPFSKGTSFIIALATVIILAVFGHFGAVAKFITNLVGTKTGLIILSAVLIIFLILYIALREWRVSEKKKIEEFKLRLAKEQILKTGEALSKALK